MKRSFGYAGTPSNLSESLHQRLNAYAMAAGAAGVGLLALAQPAEAQIVYTPAHVILKPGGNYLLDLTNDGKPELQFVDFAGPSFANLSVQAWGSGGSQNKVVITHGGPLGTNYAAALDRGAKIGPGPNFYECGSGSCSGLAPRLAFANLAEDGGAWVNVQNRYLGIEFPVSGETHYGWARLTVHVDGVKVQALLTGYAYESTPNTPIRAGQTSGGAGDAAAASQQASPETLPRRRALQKPISFGLQSPSLGALALGAPGFALWRKDQVGEDQ